MVALIALLAAAPPSPLFTWTGPAGSSKSFITATADGGLLLTWFEPRPENRYALMIAEHARGRWEQPRVVQESNRFFVNWADFPSVAQSTNGTWVVHWLEKTATKAYAYHVRLATSADRGRSWTPPVTVHRDTTPTEHGFVAMVPARDGSVQITWLDGREMTSEGGAMSVRAAAWLPNGTMSPEVVLDARTCECCQVSMTRAASGLVAAYRDRSADEIRDIAVVRERGGRWSEPTLVNRDNWLMKACPVNGPSVAAHGNDVGVAWFTAAGGRPAVNYALSRNGGEAFGPPVKIDEGNTLGRVHLQMVGPADAVVTWLEVDGEDAIWRLRRVRDGRPGKPTTVGQATRARAGGFPRTALVGPDLVVTWTEPGATAGSSRVRVQQIPLEKVK